MGSGAIVVDDEVEAGGGGDDCISAGLFLSPGGGTAKRHDETAEYRYKENSTISKAAKEFAASFLQFATEPTTDRRRRV